MADRGVSERVVRRPDGREEEGLEEARLGEAPPGEPGGPTRGGGWSWRRPLGVALAVVAGVLVYAFAFEKTDVDLSEIQSETRQQQLTRILRALAQPELTEYDTEEVIRRAPVAVPCGPTLPPTEDSRISVSPRCSAPGETLTVSGTGFDPGQTVSVGFVPESEFDIVLPLGREVVGGDGTFDLAFEVPERTSEEPQAVQVGTERRLGSWTDRVETYVDANENDVRDDPELGEDGRFQVVLPLQLPEVPGVALLDAARGIEQFVSFGEPFTAVNGPAVGETAVPVEETDEGGMQLADLERAEGGTRVTLQGQPGTEILGWRIALYDATTGEAVGDSLLADAVRLSPRISEEAIVTWDKIIETVALALVATTVGVAVAVPLSFFAARNIMRDISVPVTNLALTVLAVPAGVAVGLGLADLAREVTQPLRDGLGPAASALVVLSVILFGAVRWGLPREDVVPASPGTRLARRVTLLVAAAAGVLLVLLLAETLRMLGGSIEPVLGIFGFLGAFLRTLGELLDTLTPVLASLVAAGVLVTAAGRLGYGVRSRVPRPLLRVLNVALSMAAGAALLVGLGRVIEWLYRLNDPVATVWVPAAVGAVLGALVALLGMRAGQVKVGLTVYYVTRTVFNTLRSIEPLVMAIVFVVWVGIGPFAGALALALHTIAALAKLYSEQVESISVGPIEAVRATGATRLQTVVYAVIPQIVPPYISFTMYRWDINVRMSTILGFVGGGGIGFILQQNVNLFQYRAAAVQMLAIAIVVASMDWLSSRLRERYV